MLPEFYLPRPGWPERIEQIIEVLGRASAVEELSGRAPELRRTNRIGSVHSSTAIEGNRLTLAQVEDAANGEPVFAPPREVKEVENALAAYDALDDLDPWSVDDFLRAHGLDAVGVNVGVNDAILLLLRVAPTLSAAAIADRLGRTSRTIERHLTALKAAGRVRREGSAKAGSWVVID